MYEAFFQLKMRPFPSTPRTDLYFPASAIETGRQTLARCIDRAEGPGLLIGGPGTGKSLVCALLADQFRDRFHLVKLDHARFCTRRALLQGVMFELSLPYRGLDEGELRLALIEFAKSRDSHREGVLLVIDEAQTLPARLVEEVRMIGNVVVGGQPRLRLVLSGSAALEERLTSPKLESFNQRIAARCYLQPLNYDETAAYMQAQIVAAGGTASLLFADNAWQAVYHASGGIPRLINQVCDHALMLAAAAQRRILDATVIEEAWADLQQLPVPWPTKANTASTKEESVVEFGSLASDDVTVDDSDAGEPCDFEPVTTPEARDVIDLTSQLDQIELHVAEWDTAEQPERPSLRETWDQKPRGQKTPDITSPQTIPAGLAADPFGDGFEEEQPVLDHYATLESQARRQGQTAPSPQEHEFAAAIQTIFEPLPRAGAADTTPTSPPSGSKSLSVATPVVAEAVQAVCDERPAAAAPKNEAADEAADEADDSEAPATLQVEALRILPPDDSDLIVVLDSEAHIAQLSRMAGKAHRQEYRQLFTKLRGN
jgi:type II secretory pathway predicted ATPase ExeA